MEKKRDLFPHNGWIFPCYICLEPVSQTLLCGKYKIKIWICRKCIRLKKLTKHENHKIIMKIINDKIIKKLIKEINDI